MDNGLEDIKEVTTGGKDTANWYLKRGYRLLSIQSVAAPGVRTDGAFYISRRPVFIVGRPDGVERAPDPPYRAEVRREEKP